MVNRAINTNPTTIQRRGYAPFHNITIFTKMAMTAIAAANGKKPKGINRLRNQTTKASTAIRIANPMSRGKTDGGAESVFLLLSKEAVTVIVLPRVWNVVTASAVNFMGKATIAT